MSTAAQPATQQTWNDQVMRAELAALKDFEREYQSTSCGVCGSEKWIKSPFCKSCSIRLQRVHLMRPLRWALIVWRRDLLHATNSLHILAAERAAFLHWDLCRDFLINRRREAA